MKKEQQIPVRGKTPAAPVRLIDFLHRDPITVRPEARIGSTLQIMAENKIGSVIVTETPRGKPVGIFTLRDVLCRIAIPRIDHDAPIAKVMTRDPVSVSGNLAVSQAAQVMARLGLRHLLVTGEDGVLIGVVSRADISDWMCDACASIRRAKSEVVTRRHAPAAQPLPETGEAPASALEM